MRWLNFDSKADNLEFYESLGDENDKFSFQQLGLGCVQQANGGV
jgi:hypothetical protein